MKTSGSAIGLYGTYDWVGVINVLIARITLQWCIQSAKVIASSYPLRTTITEML